MKTLAVIKSHEYELKDKDIIGPVFNELFGSIKYHLSHNDFIQIDLSKKIHVKISGSGDDGKIWITNPKLNSLFFHYSLLCQVLNEFQLRIVLPIQKLTKRVIN